VLGMKVAPSIYMLYSRAEVGIWELKIQVVAISEVGIWELKIQVQYPQPNKHTVHHRQSYMLTKV